MNYIVFETKGLFVIKPLGEGVAIANDKDFKPVTW